MSYKGGSDNVFKKCKGIVSICLWLFVFFLWYIFFHLLIIFVWIKLRIDRQNVYDRSNLSHSSCSTRIYNYFYVLNALFGWNVCICCVCISYHIHLNEPCIELLFHLSVLHLFMHHANNFTIGIKIFIQFYFHLKTLVNDFEFHKSCCFSSIKYFQKSFFMIRPKSNHDSSDKWETLGTKGLWLVWVKSHIF